MIRSLTAAFVFVPLVAMAQRHDHEVHDYHHEVAFFMGGAFENATEERENFALIGTEYEYRFLPRLGVAGELEVLTGEPNAAVVAVQAMLHPYKGLMISTGPGWESKPRRVEAFGRESRFFYRLGAQYAFHLGSRYSIAPSFAVDWINEGSLGDFPLPEALEHTPIHVPEGWQPLYIFKVKFGIGF